MQDSKTRERILKKIRQALIHKTENRFPQHNFDSPIHVLSKGPLDVEFAEQFNKVNGHFIFCEDNTMFIERLLSLATEKAWDKIHVASPIIKEILKDSSFPFPTDKEALIHCLATITPCEYLVARTGTVLVSSRLASGRKSPVFPDNHLVYANTSQLVPDLKDGIAAIKQKYGEQIPSLISAITGPSRTADIEKTLVQGAHGPKEIFVFLVDDAKS